MPGLEDPSTVGTAGATASAFVRGLVAQKRRRSRGTEAPTTPERKQDIMIIDGDDENIEIPATGSEEQMERADEDEDMELGASTRRQMQIEAAVEYLEASGFSRPLVRRSDQMPRARVPTVRSSFRVVVHS
jgi:hypothetical protein